MEPVDITDEAALEAKRARIIAAVGAARKRAAEADSATPCGDANNIKAEEPFASAPSTSADDAEAQRAAAMEAKRAEVLAAVAAAKRRRSSRTRRRGNAAAPSGRRPRRIYSEATRCRACSRARGRILTSRTSGCRATMATPSLSSHDAPGRRANSSPPRRAPKAVAAAVLNKALRVPLRFDGQQQQQRAHRLHLRAV